jgi:electron transport complex protein RnfE
MPSIVIFLLPPGGFFVFGLLMAIANRLSGEGKEPEEIGCAGLKGCAGCALAANCSITGNKNGEAEKK